VSQRPEYAILAKLLVEARERSGISQNELARRLGRRQVIVWRFESALQSPDLIELADISVATNADLVELIAAWQTACADAKSG